MSNNQNKTARASIFGGLSGGIFFFGLAIAIVFSSHYNLASASPSNSIR